jgi:tetratricopeptide (TPR) repeat protein
MDYRLEQLRFELREDPSSRVFFKLGEHLRREGELREAIAVLGNGLEQHPKYVAAWVSLGRALLDAGSSRQAAEALSRALALDPENAVASRFAGEAAIANGEWVEAIKAFKRARALSAPDDVLDQRILFVEGHLAEIGELRVAPPAARPTEAPAGSQPTGRSLDTVFADAEPEPMADSAGDDVFVIEAPEEDVADQEPPPENDGRATVAIALDAMPIPRFQDEGPSSEPFATDAAPQDETPLEIDADAILEAAAADEEPATVPIAVMDVESTTEPEPDFDFDLLDEADPRSDELPLPTMTLARLALDQGDLELAERTLRGVLDRDPDHAEATRLLAGLTAAGGGAGGPGGDAAAETGDARARALQRWLEAVRLASEKLKT